jgi:uncharacterized membrane protein
VRSKIHVAFTVGVILKGLNGLAELIGGVLLLVFSATAVQQFVVDVTPWSIPHLSQHDKIFAAIYMLSHGVIKAVLVYALLKEKLWAFPSAMVVFSLFGVYQMIRYFHHPSVWLIVLTLLDVFVILLTWAEWRRVTYYIAARAT